MLEYRSGELWKSAVIHADRLGAGGNHISETTTRPRDRRSANATALAAGKRCLGGRSTHFPVAPFHKLNFRVADDHGTDPHAP